MSAPFLPLGGGPAPLSAGSLRPIPLAKDPAADRGGGRAAKAAREFQALFLMELMRPLTESLSRESAGGADGGLARDVYAWFWNEGLARHLAGSLPLPDPGLLAPPAPPASGPAPVPADPAPRRVGAAADPVPAIAPRPPGPVPAARPAGSAAAPGDGAALPSSAGSVSPRRRGGLDALIERAAGLYEVPANLVRAVVAVESGGRADAVSRKGAVGLMQLMPSTARDLEVRDLRDPWENLVGGVRYLKRQLDRFGQVESALAAYNAGPGAVDRHGGVPPYPETRTYIGRVLAAKARFDLDRPAGA